MAHTQRSCDFGPLIGKTFFNRGDGIALVYGTVMRNLSIALAVAINAFGEAGTDAALVIALAYIIQVQSAAWYFKFTDTFYGWIMAALQVQTNQKTIIMEIPLVYLYALMPLMGVLVAIRTIQILYEDTMKLVVKKA